MPAELQNGVDLLAAKISRGYGAAARRGSYSCYGTDSRPPESIFLLLRTLLVSGLGEEHTDRIASCPPVGLAAAAVSAPRAVPEAKAHTELSSDGIGGAAPQASLVTTGTVPGPEAALNSVLNFAINTGTFGRTP